LRKLAVLGDPAIRTLAKAWLVVPKKTVDATIPTERDF
jgi:hypothetical protein